MIKKEEKNKKSKKVKPVQAAKKKVSVKKSAVNTMIKKEKIIKEAPEPVKVEEKAAPRYLMAIGRRKSATARVRLFESGQGRITVNGRELKAYFPVFQLFEMVLAPLKLTGQLENHDISIKVLGGGKQGQAEATRHGITRVLVKWNADFKPTLKKAGFLTRDSREKERKKFGLKKARRAPQWAKR